MTSLPYTRFLPGPSWSIVIAGPHIQVVNYNGDLVRSTTNIPEEEKQAILKSGPIRCAAADTTFTHLVTTGDDKKMKVWRIDGLELLSTRELPKKPTEIAFTHDAQTILVSDKFGDVFRYPLHPKPKARDETEPRAGNSKRGALTSHENPSDGELILGHVSLLTTFLLTPDEKYIITADRDEHIRVSWYPKGYVIERYCLGHEKFVSAVHVPSFAPGTLVSGGGDPVLKVWDWMSGEQIAEVPVLETVEPYIKVKAPKGRRGWNDGEDAEGGTAENNVARRRKRGRKARGKRAAAEQKEDSVEGTPVAEGEPGEANTGEDAPEGDVETPGPAEGGAQSEAGTQETDRTVLVIQKIQSLDLDEYGRILLFSAVGATALFYCAYPDANASEPPKVEAFDFGYPIVDFAIGHPDVDPSLGTNQTVWILLDTSAATHASDSAEKPSPAAFLAWISGQPSQREPNEAPGLLRSLQSNCTIPATPADLKALDLYAPLSSLPKNVDPEHDPLRRDLLAEVALAEASPPEPEARQAPKKELTMREQARLKKKRALAAKLLEKEQGKGEAGTQDDVEGSKDEVGRENKRARSDSEPTAAGAELTGEAMDES